jgi:hypothetical protein
MLRLDFFVRLVESSERRCSFPRPETAESRGLRKTQDFAAGNFADFFLSLHQTMW